MGSYRVEEKDPTENSPKTKKPPSRKNPWGNRSYADLITQAIQNAPQQRLTLSQIYEWMVKNIPHFKDKGENNSSAGWKNSIRHNLSLHTRFVRVQNEGTGKSSWWVIDPTAGEGRATRRRSSGKGNRVRPFRRHRPKPKTELPKSKALVALHNSAFVKNFRHQITQSSRYYNDGIADPSYAPYANAMHLTDNQRQRWHSSSSSSSEEFGCNEVIIPYRKFSTEFMRSSPHQYSDRSPSEISSMSLEHETEDRADFTRPDYQAYHNTQCERNSWYEMPAPFCSSEQVDDLAHTSGGNFWNVPNGVSQGFTSRGALLSEAENGNDVLYDEESLSRVHQLNASINGRNCDNLPSEIAPGDEERCNNYEYLEDLTKNRASGYLQDSSRASLAVVEYSSQRLSYDANFCNSSKSYQSYGDMSNIPVRYHHDSSSDWSDGNNYDDTFRAYNSGSYKAIMDEEMFLLPPDLCTCEVLTGLSCDISEVFQLEIDVEGSLEFLESFGTLFEV